MPSATGIAGMDPWRAFLYRPDPVSPPVGAGPLAGLAVAVKDNIHVAGMPLTCGSRMLSGYIAPYDATVVARLKAAGAVIAGKTNMDEFAFGSTGEYSAFGPTENPAAPGRVPGGSSSGSAAAVASGLVPAALGSDTGGSVRQPAACCGVVGLKPGYGRVSRYGLTAFASSMDCIGILAEDVETARRIFRVIAGPDPLDATSDRNRYTPHTDPDDVRVGIGDNWLELAEPQTAAVIRAFLSEAVPERLRTSVHMQDPEPALTVYHILASVEAASNLARFDGLRYGARLGPDVVTSRTRGFGPEVKRRILTGTWCQSHPGADRMLAAAGAMRNRLAAQLSEQLAATPVLAVPTTPGPPPCRNEGGEPVVRYRADLFTVAASLAGLPALSIPVGRDQRGCPVGLQLVGKRGSEETLLAVAEAMRNHAKGLDT